MPDILTLSIEDHIENATDTDQSFFFSLFMCRFPFLSIQIISHDANHIWRITTVNGSGSFSRDLVIWNIINYTYNLPEAITLVILHV